MIDLGARVVEHTRIRLRFEYDRAYFEALGRLVCRIVENAGIQGEKVLGVGISVPGLLSGDTTVIEHAPVLGFSRGRIEAFAEYIPFPCMFCNDASAAGLAEFWSADDMDNMAYLSLSNSIGGAILLNRTFYSGENQRSAKFGHMTIAADGKPCYCGQRGCVDAYCNARILAESSGGELAYFFELVEAGRKEHTMLWEEYLRHLALTINNLRMIFDCQVVLGGYVGGYMESYLPALRARIGQRNSFVKEGDYVTVCRYKTEASAVGAALLYVRPFIDSI